VHANSRPWPRSVASILRMSFNAPNASGSGRDACHPTSLMPTPLRAEGQLTLWRAGLGVFGRARCSLVPLIDAMNHHRDAPGSDFSALEGAANPWPRSGTPMR